MYQVVINNKFYVSDVDIGARTFDGRMVLLCVFETTTDKYNAKFFEYKEEAQSIAEQIGGKVVEYVEINEKFNITKEGLELLKYGAVKIK